MTEPIDYQTPLPHGRNLRFMESPVALRISRDTVSRFSLWREAITPAASILVLAAAAAFGALMIHRNSLASRWMSAIGYVMVLSPLTLVFWFVVREAWQNAGIVTEVAVTADAFYWRKQTLWGSSEHFWPLGEIRLVQVNPLTRFLKIHRHRGVPLGAFAYHAVDELEFAAGKLNLAIQRNRTLLPQKHDREPLRR